MNFSTQCWTLDAPLQDMDLLVSVNISELFFTNISKDFLNFPHKYYFPKWQCNDKIAQNLSNSRMCFT